MRTLRRGAGRAAWIAATASVLWLAPPAGAQDAASVSEGARVYGAMCGRCHNPRSPLERSDRAWVIIANHMRVRGGLTGTQVRDVLAFLQATNADPRERIAIGAGPVPPPTPRVGVDGALSGPASSDSATIAEGKRLFAEKACLGCHIIGGQGGRVGPDLDAVTRRRPIVFLRRKLADPIVDNPTSMMPNFNLTAAEIEAVVAYLASLAGK